VNQLKRSSRRKSGSGDDGGDVEEGEIKWCVVAERLGIPGRKGKQCRDRWSQQLRPGIKKGAWTPEEEELLKDLHQTFGPK